MLLRMGAVETRQGLHRQYACQGFVHVHRVQQRLVEAGDEFVGDHQEAIRVLLEPGRNILAREAVQVGLGFLIATDLEVARIGDDGAVRAFALLQVA